jgi:hypothetical protein
MSFRLMHDKVKRIITVNLINPENISNVPHVISFDHIPLVWHILVCVFGW